MSCHVEQYRFRIYFRLSFRIMIFSLMWNVNSRRVPISITEVLCFKFHIIKKKTHLRSYVIRMRKIAKTTIVPT